MSPTDKSARTRGKPVRILVVEDQRIMRDALAELLHGEGYRVETASDGIEGWTKLRDANTPYDLVITDLRMPTLDGFALIRMMREAEFSGRVMVYSSALTPACNSQLAALSVDAAVSKGERIEELLQTIAAVLDPSPPSPDGSG